MQAVELFSGVGGMSLGAFRAGLDLSACVEIDKQAAHAHTINFPNANHINTDATTLSSEELRTSAALNSAPFAVIGGPPCQGFSTIGHRNTDDPRNSLFVKFFEFVQELQPSFYVAENVPGIMSPSNAEIRHSAMSFVQNDYQIIEPFKVSAEDYGVPTSRKRVLFIGYKSNYFHQLTPASFLQNNNSINTVRSALSGLPAHIRSTWQAEPDSWRRVKYKDIQDALTKSYRGRIPKGVGCRTAIKRLREDNLISGCFGTSHSEEVKKRWIIIPQGGRDDISRAVRLDLDGLCPTLRAGTGPDRGSYQAVRPIHPTANRVITPREAARLQGFPDWFQFSPTKWHSFRQIGNSVCPPVAEYIFRRILKSRIK